MKQLSSTSASRILANTGELRDSEVFGTLKFENGINKQNEIQIIHCEIDKLVIYCTHISTDLVLSENIIRELYFYDVFFERSLKLMGNNISKDYVLTHFGVNGVYHMEGNNINGFSDFAGEDFHSEVYIKNNKFTGGTNLLGLKDKPFQPRFLSGTKIIGNTGVLDSDDHIDAVNLQ